MTYEELKDKYGVYFDTFMLDPFFIKNGEQPQYPEVVVRGAWA